MPEVPLFPEQASTIAAEVDQLYFFLIAVSVLIAGGIFLTLLVFAVRYRRRPGVAYVPREPVQSSAEWVWIAGLFVVAMTMFGWGAELFYRQSRVPAGAFEVRVTAKQWMWKLQHPTGQREINELHVPTGRPVKLILRSDDVIHGFYVPAFRIKQDVLPGRFTLAWFEAARPGEYHLFCAEYCGTGHSHMVGRVVVMAPREYERWLTGAPRGEEPLGAAGEKLFARLGCANCHHPGSGPRGPDLAGLFGRKVDLADGGTAIADEDYLREAILQPAARVTAGFEPIMPTYTGQIAEEQVLELVEYLKSLTPGSPVAGPVR